jgi:hypothetical protein
MTGLDAKTLEELSAGTRGVEGALRSLRDDARNVVRSTDALAKALETNSRASRQAGAAHVAGRFPGAFARPAGALVPYQKAAGPSLFGPQAPAGGIGTRQGSYGGLANAVNYQPPPIPNLQRQGGVGAFSAAKPVIAAFATAMAAATSAVSTFVELAGTASPGALSTFQDSLTLLAAKIGSDLVPELDNMSEVIQGIGRAWEEFKKNNPLVRYAIEAAHRTDRLRSELLLRALGQSREQGGEGLKKNRFHPFPAQAVGYAEYNLQSSNAALNADELKLELLQQQANAELARQNETQSEILRVINAFGRGGVFGPDSNLGGALRWTPGVLGIGLNISDWFNR